MKKFLVILLSMVAAMCLCFGIAGCKGKDNGSGNSGDNENLGGNGGTQIQNPADKYSEEQIAQMLADFEWERYDDGLIVIKKLKDREMTEVAIPNCVSIIGSDAFA